ncbi:MULTISPECIES: hypothetical protein [Methanobacterium]|uniref:Uncharacterized protein n=1 Tax=Methanobacterium veterum TaxID=408577 RepID=A0A9E5DHU4_9EURY|nr:MULTISPECIES: hypothetical protein [Methanobacterium]MCZ3366161.1 hypothetical protein [Methanobacterium veterum]MCZ3371611.1 hypothetical protein [Methanobacterium veterum]
MNDDDKTIESMVEEYKMSMGGLFFNNFTKEPEKDMELEELIIKKGIDNHLFDTHELLSIYDNLSEYNKREFFQRVVVAFIKFKFQEDTVE